MPKPRSPAILSAALLSLVCSHQSVWSCSCVQKLNQLTDLVSGFEGIILPTIQEGQGDAIFIGVVELVQEPEISEGGGPPHSRERLALLAVERLWSGPTFTNIWVSVPLYLSMCGIRFEEAEIYLIVGDVQQPDETLPSESAVPLVATDRCRSWEVQAEEKGIVIDHLDSILNEASP